MGTTTFTGAYIQVHTCTSWPWVSMGRLGDTAPVRCDLCVNGGGVLADVCAASDVWCTGL